MSPPPAGSPVCVTHPAVAAHRPCDRCGLPFCADCLVSLRGQTVCAACKHATLSTGFSSCTVMVSTRKQAAPMEAGADTTPLPTQSPCAQHENQEAVAVCERCGDFICLLCLTPFEGRSYCLTCFELLWDRGQFGRRRTDWNSWENPAMAVLLATIAWILVLPPFLSWLPGIGAIAIGAGALNRIAREPERGKRGIAIAAIIAAVLALIVSSAITLTLFR